MRILNTVWPHSNTMSTPLLYKFIFRYEFRVLPPHIKPYILLLEPSFLPSNYLHVTNTCCVPIKYGSGADTDPVGFRLSGQTQRYLFSILKIHHSYRKNNSDRAHTPRTASLHIIHAEMEQTFKKKCRSLSSFPFSPTTKTYRKDPIIGSLFFTSFSVRCGQLVRALRTWESIGIHVFICDM